MSHKKHRLTESDFRLMSHFQRGYYDAISCRKVLLSSECTRTICPALTHERPPFPDPFVPVHIHCSVSDKDKDEDLVTFVKCDRSLFINRLYPFTVPPT